MQFFPNSKGYLSIEYVMLCYFMLESWTFFETFQLITVFFCSTSHSYIKISQSWHKLTSCFEYIARYLVYLFIFRPINTWFIFISMINQTVPGTLIYAWCCFVNAVHMHVSCKEFVLETVQQSVNWKILFNNNSII